MRCFTLVGTVMTLGLCLIFGSVAEAQLGVGKKRDKSPDKIKVTVKKSKLTSSGRQKLTITIKIDKGWYIYANPVGNKDLEPAATKILFKGKSAPKVTKITYPKGKLKKDEIVGNYRIYSPKVTIKAEIQRTSRDPFDMYVQVQSCNKKGVCLLPGKAKVTVK